MATRHFLPFLLLLFFGSACEKESTSLIDETVLLYYQDTTQVYDEGTTLNITFTEVVEDSRCPLNAVCIWAGRILVELQIGEDQSLILGLGDLTTSTENPHSNEAEFDGYTITLIDASQFANGEEELKDYWVTFTISK